MAEFTQALRDAECELVSDAAVESARARVEARIREREQTRMGRHLWAPVLALALCSVMAVSVYALIIDPQDEVGSALVAEPPTPVVRRALKPRPGMEHGQRGAEPTPEPPATARSASLPRSPRVPPSLHEVIDPWLPAPTSQPSVSPAPSGSNAMKTSEGALVAIAIGGSCELSVDGTSHGVRSSLRLKVPAGPHTVSCKLKDGSIRSQRVNVKTDKPGIASFRVK